MATALTDPREFYDKLVSFCAKDEARRQGCLVRTLYKHTGRFLANGDPVITSYKPGAEPPKDALYFKHSATLYGANYTELKGIYCGLEDDMRALVKYHAREVVCNRMKVEGGPMAGKWELCYEVYFYPRTDYVPDYQI